LSWKCTSGDAVTEDSAEVFTKNNPIPSPKMITFNRGDAIEIVAHYGPHPALPSDQHLHIAKYLISNIPPAQDTTAKVKVKVKLDTNGVFNLESAQFVESVDQPQPSEPQPMETEAAPAEPAAAKTDEEPKKRKVKRTDISFTAHTSSLQDVNKLIDEEGRMAAADQLAIETAERKNAVESYVYNIRSRLGSDLVEFSTDTERDTLSKLADETENWLYGDGEDVTKSAYQGKLDELQKLGEPIVLRKREHEERPEAIKSLVDTISHWQTEASSTDEKYSHIDKADKDKILADVAAARDWFFQQRAKQDATAKTANPVLLASDIMARKNNLDKVSRTILSKPKPKPKPVEPEPKPAETKPAEPKPAEPAQPPPEGEAAAQEESKEPTKPEAPMDVD